MNKGFDVYSFIKCSHALELDVILTAKVIRYYTGDRFEYVIKSAIADQYIDDVDTGNYAKNLTLLHKMVNISKVSNSQCINKTKLGVDS